MPGPGDHERVPNPVPPLPLPEFGYDDLERGERIGLTWVNPSCHEPKPERNG